MSIETYHVYFSGQIMKDRDPAEVRKKIGQLFKVEGDKLERLFSGQPVAIKKDVDMEQAVKYRVAFREAGALVEIRPASGAPASPAPVQRPAAPPPGPAATAPEPVAQSAEPQSFSLSAPNSYDLSDCTPPAERQPLPDISGLDLDKPGVILDTSAPPQPLSIDTDDWELDRPGVDLDVSEPAPEIAIDTTALTLNPANQGSLEDCQQPVTPAPLPSIDHLEFAEEKPKPQGKAVFHTSED